MSEPEVQCPRCEQQITQGEVCMLTDDDGLVHADHFPAGSRPGMFFYWGPEQVEEIRRERAANSGDN